MLGLFALHAGFAAIVAVHAIAGLLLGLALRAAAGARLIGYGDFTGTQP